MAREKIKKKQSESGSTLLEEVAQELSYFGSGTPEEHTLDMDAVETNTTIAANVQKLIAELNNLNTAGFRILTQTEARLSRLLESAPSPKLGTPVLQGRAREQCELLQMAIEDARKSLDIIPAAIEVLYDVKQGVVDIHDDVAQMSVEIRQLGLNEIHRLIEYSRDYLDKAMYPQQAATLYESFVTGALERWATEAKRKISSSSAQTDVENIIETLKAMRSQTLVKRRGGKEHKRHLQKNDLHFVLVPTLQELCTQTKAALRALDTQLKNIPENEQTVLASLRDALSTNEGTAFDGLLTTAKTLADRIDKDVKKPLDRLKKDYETLRKAELHAVRQVHEALLRNWLGALRQAPNVTVQLKQYLQLQPVLERLQQALERETQRRVEAYQRSQQRA